MMPPFRVDLSMLVVHPSQNNSITYLIWCVYVNNSYTLSVGTCIVLVHILRVFAYTDILVCTLYTRTYTEPYLTVCTFP